MCRGALLVLVLAAGCGFTIRGPDPERPLHEAPRCDTSKGRVLLDGVGAAAFGGLAIGVARFDRIDGQWDAPLLVAIPAAVSVMYLLGAVVGETTVNDCREAMDQHARARRR